MAPILSRREGAGVVLPQAERVPLGVDPDREPTEPGDGLLRVLYAPAGVADLLALPVDVVDLDVVDRSLVRPDLAHHRAADAGAADVPVLDLAAHLLELPAEHVPVELLDRLRVLGRYLEVDDLTAHLRGRC